MYYTWEQDGYRKLMVNILNHLEPIKFESEYIILDELDESNYVVFLLQNEKVQYHIGYSVNKQHIYKIKQQNQEIGAYGVTFDKKSNYIYKTKQESEGFFIRRKHWKNVINDENTKDCVLILKQQIKKRYEFMSDILENLKSHDLNTITLRNGKEGVI